MGPKLYLIYWEMLCQRSWIYGNTERDNIRKAFINKWFSYKNRVAFKGLTVKILNQIIKEGN